MNSVPHTAGSRLSKRTFWIFQITYWLVSTASLVFMIKNYHPVDDLNWVVVRRIVTGFLLTLLLHWIYQQPFMIGRKGADKWLWVSILTVAACLLGTFFWMPLIHWFNIPELSSSALSQFFSITVARLFSLLIWNAVYFGIEGLVASYVLKQEVAQAAMAAQTSELKQLQAQLHPHFLFNSLNTIKASKEDPQAVEEITQNLADFLRFSLTESKSLESLGREIEALDSYIGLQRARFRDDLDCSFEVSPAALKVRVPPMLLQPLLENAFKFGPQTGGVPLRLVVKAIVADSWLTISVANSGRWVEPSDIDGHGTGLANLRRRLVLLMGEQATMDVSNDSEWVTVSIRIPLVRVSTTPDPAMPPC